jgi:hypothetical protein
MLHHRGQLDWEGGGQFADRHAALALKLRKNRASRGIHQRREDTVEPFLIVHHLLKYRCASAGLSMPPGAAHGKQTAGQPGCD